MNVLIEKTNNNLDDLVAWEFQHGDMHSIASHEITVENTQDRLVGDDQQVILLALKFEDYGLKTDSEIMVRLSVLAPAQMVGCKMPYLSSRVSVVVWILLMLLYLFGIDATDCTLRELLANTWIKLAHLRALADRISKAFEVFGSLNSPLSGGSPDGQRPKWNIRTAFRDQRKSLILTMGKKSVSHLPSIVPTLVGKRGISFVRVLVARRASPGKERQAGLNMEIHEVEYDSVGEISERDVVVLDSLPSVDHLDIVKIRFIHGLEVWNLEFNSSQIKLCCLIRVHTYKLEIVNRPQRNCRCTYIRGRYLDVACVLLENLFVGYVRFQEEGLMLVSSHHSVISYASTHLNIMLGELLVKRPTSSSERINGIVDRNLAILMVQPSIDILAALLEYLLAKQNGRGGRVDKEVVLGDVDVWAHCSATIVTEMENPGLDTKPEKLRVNTRVRSVTLPLEITAERDRDVAAMRY